MGESVDLLWAPASSYLIGALFNDAQFARLGLLEELLPGTDIVPTATLVSVFFYQYAFVICLFALDESIVVNFFSFSLSSMAHAHMHSISLRHG